ncbi:hypothetical protein [Pseudoxanthomonas putridarboris]|uniref:Uncharacterized protein n=1 Tax=Pseudoxanthomonas putridarboris TaxID=752605 RepID=A0ABU9J1R7_9GAMM
MKTPHEPLTPEERELAAQLSRLGPHGGPSPQLDARILSAARTAVQGTDAARAPRTRWPLRLGVAASVLLAVGVAWQLRPLEEVPVASEVPAAVVSAPAAADAGAPAEKNAGLVSEPAQDVAATDPARQNAEAAARQESAPRRSPLSIIPAVPGLPVPAESPPPVARRAAPQAFPEAPPARDDALDRVAARLPPPPPSPPAPVAVPETREKAILFRAPEAQQHEQRDARGLALREEETAAEARKLEQVVVTGTRIRSSDAADGYRTRGLNAPASAPPPPPAPAASAGSNAEPSAARTALRRTDLQLPVDQDTHLPPGEWLDRIRLRRDLGDAANATRSLQLFVQEHPFQRVPEDLRPLLGEP